MNPEPNLYRFRSLTSDISALTLALLAGLLVCVLLRLQLLPMLFIPDPTREIIVIDDRLSTFLVVTYSLLVGFTLEHWGARQCWAYLSGSFLAVVSIGTLGSTFVGIDLPVVPLVLSGILAAVFVQLYGLWKLDRELTRALFVSANALGPIEPSEVSTQLAGGLKMLDTVLPLKEAVIFRACKSDPFQIVARLKGSTSRLNMGPNNTLWRDGIQLCERALAHGEISHLRLNDGSGSSVAVPLRHETESVGVLLLHLSKFCEDDGSLLDAFASQFARNIKRHDFSSNPVRHYTLGYFSKTSSQKKLDAVNVLKAYLTEERCNPAALRQISDGIALAYLDGSVAFTNARLLEFAGITREQLKGLNLFSLLDIFRTGVFDEPAIAVKRVLQTGVAYDGELEFSERGQTLGVRISLVRNRSDQTELSDPIGIAVYVRDLTRIKDYDKLKSDMISLMSHELRTPLTSINGFAELLSVDESLPEPAREFVTIIANESQRLSRMINTFLAVTQLQRKDKQEVLKIPLRLDEVVHDTITTLQPLAKKKRIRLVEQQAHRVPPVAADRSLITQAVKNLVNNAIKYSPERTTVTVSTALEAEAVRVRVEDRGFGIPSEARDRVWDKFYRVVREGQEKDEESTGLGLSFVREVVEQHGGQVQLDSEEGRGSIFSFTLPRL